MKKGMKRTAAFAVVMALMLSACGGTASPNKTDDSSGSSNTGSAAATADAGTSAAARDKYQMKELVIPRLATRELETWNILQSQRAENEENLVQLVDGLLECNPKGQLVPAIAESWETTDGGRTWIFKIREGVKWVDWQGNEKADCNAYDFITGLEWVLNFHKNQSANTSMPMEMIQGAAEYYQYTHNLTEEEGLALRAEAGSDFLGMVGIEAVDEHTLKYTCITEMPYFDTLAPYVALYPVSQACIDEIGVEQYASIDNTTMWYNGAYTCTEFIHGNSKTFTKNPLYWDLEAQRFDNFTYVYVDSDDTAYTLFQNGDVDYVELTEATLNTIRKDENHEYYDNFVDTIRTKYSYQWHWNYDKHHEDGTKDDNWNKAIANTAFRQSIYYGLDLTEVYRRIDAIDPLSVENNYYTMEGLVYTSDGTEYTQLVREKLGLGEYNGSSMARYDADKADALKAQAMEELTALGVTFPVELDYYIPASSQTDLDNANVLKSAISKSLGDDYITLHIGTYVSSQSQEVRNPRIQSLLPGGWGADYGDPMNYMAQEIKDYDNAWYAAAYSNINDVPREDWSEDLHAAYDKYTEMVWAADAITDDVDARYEAFAEAEAYMIDQCLVMPHHYGKYYCLTKYNLHSQQNAMFGSTNTKMKNIETQTEPYTQEQWEAIKAAK